jgi:glycosyltransferase involved in cell wall biosynthesis
MKFSVLIAHFNNFDYFMVCYESLVKQSFQDFEIVVLDDHSTDDSYEKLKNFIGDKPQIRLHQNEVNKGVGFTKNKLVHLAKGEICGFVDPDDALVPDALFLSVNAYEPNVVATYSKMYFCDENLKVEKIYNMTRKVKSFDPLFFNIHFEISHFFTFRKSAYNHTSGIQEKYLVAEDMDIYLKLYELGKIKFIDAPLYYYRIHKKGLSHDQEKKKRRYEQWHDVILNALKRRNITKLYGKNIHEIKSLPEFIFIIENTYWKKLKRKVSCLWR